MGLVVALSHTQRERKLATCVLLCVFVCAYTLGPVRPIVGWHDREMVKTYKCPLSFPFYTPWHTHSVTRVFFLSLFYWVDWRGEMMIVSHHQVSCRWTQSHRRCPSVTSSRYWCVAAVASPDGGSLGKFLVELLSPGFYWTFFFYFYFSFIFFFFLNWIEISPLLL
jgi:hypothetical protein